MFVGLIVDEINENIRLISASDSVSDCGRDVLIKKIVFIKFMFSVICM